MIWIEIFFYILTTIVSFLSLVMGLSTDFFGLLKDSSDASLASASFALAILVVLIGDRITAGIRDSTFMSNVKQELERNLRGIPEFNSIIEFTTCDFAQEYLCSRVPFAKVIFNTKVSDAGIEPRVDIATNYTRILKTALKNGLVYKDVISPAFREYAEQLESASTSLRGSYKYKLLDSTPPSFINFIVLEYRNGDEELLFGWATSVYRGMEQKTYKIRDQRVISYFKGYHAALFERG